MLYIVVPTYNRIDIFNAFIKQMKSQTCQDYQLVIVDHGKQKTNYRDDKDVVIESDVNGWSYAINVGIRYVLDMPDVTDSDHIMVINDDVIMDDDYIQIVHNAIKEKPGALIGSGCYDCDSDKVLHLNMRLNKPKAVFYYYNQSKTRNELTGKYYESDVLKGRGTVLPVAVLRKIGIYDEKRLPHYRADHELAWRAKKNSYEVYVSGDMWLGAKLDSPHTVDGAKSLKENYHAMFKDMISTQNTKDLWNYSFCCFDKLYGLYFFCMNYIRFHLIFYIKYFKEKKKK